MRETRGSSRTFFGASIAVVCLGLLATACVERGVRRQPSAVGQSEAPVPRSGDAGAAPTEPSGAPTVTSAIAAVSAPAGGRAPANGTLPASLSAPGEAPPTPSSTSKETGETPPTPSRALAVPAIIAGTADRSSGGVIMRALPSPPEPKAPSPSGDGATVPSTQQEPVPPSVPPTRPTVAPAQRGILTLRVTSSLTEVAINQTFTAEIVASSDAGVVDAPFHLLFDPAVLEFLDATQGEFLGEDGSSIIFIVNGRARPGDVAIGIGRANREQGASGTGVLARIRFSALAPGETYLRLDRSVAWDAGGNRMEVSTVGVAVAVR